MMIQIEKLCVHIGQKEILSDIHFGSDSGLLAVVGPNGAGKSTLIKALSGTLALTSGSVFWKNFELKHWKKEIISKQRAVLTQQTRLSHDFSVKEVLMMGRYPHFAHQARTIDFDIIKYTAQKMRIEHLIDRSYNSLSGGESQRVQISRVLAQIWTNPEELPQGKLLLLDEPLNNLDVRHQFAVLELAQELAKAGNLVITVLHDINLAAQYADRILLMQNGKICGYGSPAAVLTESRLCHCYDFPVKVGHHPWQACPMVYFGETKTLNHQSNSL